MIGSGIPITFEIQRQRPKMSEGEPGHDNFELQRFFPYLVRVFYTHISSAVSQVYESGHQLSAPEWRTMAILGEDQSLTAAEIVERSSMDKVSVSRAVSKLRKRGWLLERVNKCDGRSRVLKLSRQGSRAFRELVPKMLDAEKKMLASLSEDERAKLIELMARVGKAAAT